MGNMSANVVETEVVLKLDIDRAFGSLDHRLRETLQLCVLEDQTLSDAGEELGVTSTRVRQLRSSALRKLRKLLRDYDTEREEAYASAVESAVQKVKPGLFYDQESGEVLTLREFRKSDEWAALPEDLYPWYVVFLIGSEKPIIVVEGRRRGILASYSSVGATALRRRYFDRWVKLVSEDGKTVVVPFDRLEVRGVSTIEFAKYENSLGVL